MNIYVWVALVAVLMKVYIGIASRNYQWATPDWFFLVSTFLLLNLVELLGYHQFSLEIFSIILLKTYFVALIFLLCAVLRFVRSESSEFQRIVGDVSLLLSILLAVLVLVSPYIIDGYHPGTYPAIAIKGDYFSVYLSVGLLNVVLSILFVLLNLYKSVSHRESREHTYNLISLLPFFITSMVIGGGMLMGFNINGSGFFPVASTLFMLGVLVLRCKPHYLVDTSIPFTKVRSISLKAGENLIIGAHESGSLKPFLAEQERLYIECSLDHIGKNKSKMARHLGIDRRTLDRKLKNHDLWWKG